METNVQDLLNKYEEIYLSRSRDFNALTTVHLSENDHTNILREILNMQVNGKKPFMASFFREVLGIKDKMDYNNLVAKTQVQAISAKGLGFIDLLIEGNGKHIIVENKVCGAGDGPFQLARYYFSYIRDNDYFEQLLKDCSWEEFHKDEIKYAEDLSKQHREWWEKEQNDVSPEIYIVYLTDIADKEPSKNSLPKELKENRLKNHYIHISYEEDIYDWLKTKVLPLVPYGKTGDAANSIIIYLHELENILASNVAQNQWYLEKEQVQDFINEIFHATDSQTNVHKYERLDAIYKTLKETSKLDEYKDNSILSDLINCVLCHRNNVFGKFAPEGWTVYCAGDYITFYPTWWLAKYGGTTSSCIHFILTKWRNSGLDRQFNLDIHNNACKKYMNDKNTYEERQMALMDCTKNIKIDVQDPDLIDHDAALKSYLRSNHYYWHLYFDSEKIKKELGITWDPNANDEEIERFFKTFVQSEEIQKLVKYIDEIFK